MANRKIKNTNPGGLGTYIGANELRDHVFFAGGGAVTEVDDKKLAEAMKDPIFAAHFDAGLLVDITAVKAPAPKAEETKSTDDGKGKEPAKK